MLETRDRYSGIKLVQVNCDLCGSSDLETWDHARANTLNRCRCCGLIFTNPRVGTPKEKDELFYAEHYFNRKPRMTPKMMAARRISYAREVKILEKLRAPGRILDVGCGTGEFLQALGPGWEKHGCDISTYAVEQAMKKGISAHLGEFERIDFGPKSFDVVYFRATLHHTFSPRASLARAAHVLPSGGVLAVVMSNNADGPCGRLFRGHVRSYEQAHNYLFTSTSLTCYLEQAGFDLIHTDIPYFGTGYVSWSDFITLLPRYATYLWLKAAGRLNTPATYGFCSPPFWGNYVSVYGVKRA
ncbi:MAG: class I SAM-dependent methyltransferase [Planctomycetes bacterium]|nr:class I SAM-dependent methyltransferase [Planctomycetota bacterium]